MKTFKAMKLATMLGTFAAEALNTECAVVVTARGNAVMWDLVTPDGGSLMCGAININSFPDCDVDADEIAARERAASGTPTN